MYFAGKQHLRHTVDSGGQSLTDKPYSLTVLKEPYPMNQNDLIYLKTFVNLLTFPSPNQILRNNGYTCWETTVVNICAQPV